MYIALYHALLHKTNITITNSKTICLYLQLHTSALSVMKGLNISAIYTRIHIHTYIHINTHLQINLIS